MTAPVRLGIAGGPIVMGILIGALGPRVQFISYMTRSAGLMLRELGLALYLGCSGPVGWWTVLRDGGSSGRFDVGRHRLPHHGGACGYRGPHHPEDQEV